MKYIKIAIEVECNNFSGSTLAKFEIYGLISLQYGNLPLKAENLTTDFEKIMKLVKGKNCMITFYLQTASSYPYTTVKGHRYVINNRELKFAPLVNGMFENWHMPAGKHNMNARILEYIEGANELFVRALRTQTVTA